MFRKSRMIHPRQNKNTAGSPAKTIPEPRRVTLPLSMHIGAPALPVVSPGDRVYVGSLVARADGKISSSVYSSVSGTVEEIKEITLPGGRETRAVVILSDGTGKPDPSLRPPKIGCARDLADAAANAGLVGLGGAGFPTEIKLDTKQKIEEIIINCAECEPYITSDTRTMLERTDDIVSGAKLLLRHIPCERIIFGVEDNKPECIKTLRDAFESEPKAKIVALITGYPQGAERVIVPRLTGKIIPLGKLPADVGCLVMNCTTLGELARYVRTGMPLVKRCVTVDGSAVKSPKNLIAAIGTPASELFSFCGGFSSDPAKIIFGGPMMGAATSDISSPILKTTNAIVAMSESEASILRTTACIRCGRCVRICPVKLMPAALENAYDGKNVEALRKFRVDGCIECGCCNYVCPSGRHLVEKNRLGKKLLKEAAK